MLPQDIVKSYLDKNYRIVIWPHIGDNKGPREPGWPQKVYTIDDYFEGCRVGLLNGVEVSPGKFLIDIDIDWAPGFELAGRLLPPTKFAFGRSSKRISHCYYLLPEAIQSYSYLDIDNTKLIEIFSVKKNGELGHQTMAPPSVWSKEGHKESLEFVKFEDPTFIESVSAFKQSVCLTAIGMLFVKNLGPKGFNHEVRRAWAGFLLRAGLSREELEKMGQGIIFLTKNNDTHDISAVIDSTANQLAAGGKIEGGPTLKRLIGKNGKAVIDRINEWLGRDSDFIRDQNGQIIKNSQENIKRAVEILDLKLRHNDFSERIHYQESESQKDSTFNKHTTDRLWLRLDRECRFRPEFVFFDKVVRDIAYENSFHPVVDYFQTLQWDGEKRDDTWLIKYGGAADTPFVRAISAIFLIAAVRRIKQPGCKYDEMLVLESSQQGLNKSTALRTLCPNDDWFSEDLPLNVDSKQIIERTLGKWIIEASDLTGGRKADRDHLKSFLSRQVDGPARMAYAHDSVERARHFVIVGTTNSVSYLVDPTGARRFWPVTVKRFDTEAIARDKDQLWAEAVAREATGESIRLPEELWPAAADEQEGRREADAWEDAIAEHLPLLKLHVGGRVQLSTAKIWELLNIPLSNRDRGSALRISEIMQRLKFTRTKIWDDGKTQAGYVGQQVRLALEDEVDKDNTEK